MIIDAIIPARSGSKRFKGKNKGYLIQNQCVGDIDFEWQKQVVLW